MTFALLSHCAFAQTETISTPPKNIIFMIGDGMGPAYTTAFRYFNDNLQTKEIESTVFDTILTGMSRTYPDDDTYVTDSAAGATALSSGHKTYNGAIAVDNDKSPTKTMLEIAKEKNMITALIATSQINHATPASFASHNEYRRNYNEIADDYIDNKINGKLPVDLLFGGGTDYFKRSDRNLINEFIKSGYQYTESLKDLDLITQLPAIGLFAKIGLPYVIDSKTKHLEKMTTKAFSLLENNSRNGFFIMIEGSQIDWCGHNNDISCAMAEMNDFANSISIAKKYVDKHPDTLLVVTADHSTGGLTLGANGLYKWETQIIKDLNVSAKQLSDNLFESSNLESIWKNHSKIKLTVENLKALNIAKAKNKEALFLAVKKIINDLSYTGWTTDGHTAVDVQIFAYGQGSKLFHGSMNNTDIAKQLINIIQ
nr:alkaline phosphatase [Pseudoalteromonas denitrificans]